MLWYVGNGSQTRQFYCSHNVNFLHLLYCYTNGRLNLSRPLPEALQRQTLGFLSPAYPCSYLCCVLCKHPPTRARRSVFSVLGHYGLIDTFIFKDISKRNERAGEWLGTLCFLPCRDTRTISQWIRICIGITDIRGWGCAVRPWGSPYKRRTLPSRMMAVSKAVVLSSPSVGYWLLLLSSPVLDSRRTLF